MPYFPVFLDLSDTTCLVAGAGDVGRRKIFRLLDCGAGLVRIVDPDPPQELLRELGEHPRISFARRSFQPADIEGAFLVIASTGDQETNALISRLCRENGIPCNIVDQPDKCSFIVPALISRGDLNIAISTDGSSPALAGKIKQELDQLFGPEHEAWLDLLKRLRPLILELGLPQSENKAIFQSLTEDSLLAAIRAGDRQALKQALRQRLPAAVQAKLGAILP